LPFVCYYDNSKGCGRILMKFFFGGVASMTNNKRLDLGGENR